MLTKDNAKTEAALTDQSKTIALFQFIRELNKLKQKAILNIMDYPWMLALSALPEDPENIRVYYRDRVEDELENEDGKRENTLLSVHKPEFQKCPEPDAIFKDWLLSGWDNYRNEPEVKKIIELKPEKKKPMLSPFDSTPEDAEEELQRELFTDNTERVKGYESWLAVRSEWAAKQKITERTRVLFADLYRYYFELQRESETEEIIVANGMLCDAKNPEIRHPVLTHRVKIGYDADSNTVSIVDTDTPSELYSMYEPQKTSIHFAPTTIKEPSKPISQQTLVQTSNPEEKKLIISRLPEKKIAAPAAPTNKPSSKGTNPIPSQQSFPGMPTAEKKSVKKSNSDAFVEELKAHHLEFVDNRKQSNIVWVIYDKDNKTFIESTVSKFKLKAPLERRGAIATSNRPAWRVMI